MASSAAIKIKRKKKNIFWVTFDNVPIAGKKYIKSNIEDIVYNNILRGVTNFSLQDDKNEMYDLDDFSKLVTVKDFNTYLEVKLDKSVIRKISNKYLCGDMDIETQTEEPQPEFDFLENFFKNNLSAVEKWSFSDKQLKSKYSITQINK